MSNEQQPNETSALAAAFQAETDGRRNAIRQVARTVHLATVAEAGTVKTSYDLTSLDGKRLAARAVLAFDMPASEYLNQPIDVAGYVSYVAPLVSRETGEILPVPCTVLVSADGDRIRLTSEVCQDQFANLIGSFGPPPWPWLGRIVIKEAKGQGGHKYHYLDIVS